MRLNAPRFDVGRMRNDYASERRTATRDVSEGMSEKAFGHAVMEGTMTLSEGGHGPAEHGFAIDFLIVVTL